MPVLVMREAFDSTQHKRRGRGKAADDGPSTVNASLRISNDLARGDGVGARGKPYRPRARLRPTWAGQHRLNVEYESIVREIHSQSTHELCFQFQILFDDVLY